LLILGVAAGGALFSGVAVAASGSTPSAPTATAARASAALVAATNAERRDAGCAPVRVDEQLPAVAQAHASDMARNGYISHTSQDGTTSRERISEGGYPRANAENIASGYPSAAEVMEAWMGSPTHRRNIVDCRFTAIGVGYAADGDHWVQDFGG
jgi:uncharacterized protein YkwD